MMCAFLQPQFLSKKVKFSVSIDQVKRIRVGTEKKKRKNRKNFKKCNISVIIQAFILELTSKAFFDKFVSILPKRSQIKALQNFYRDNFLCRLLTYKVFECIMYYSFVMI